MEVILTLFGFKMLYPDCFHMSRGECHLISHVTLTINHVTLVGNHESATMNQMYGFEGEVKSKYSSKMAELFTEVFNWLPLAHCIEGKVFVTHGGIFSKDGITLDDIRQINRNRQPPEEG